MPDRKLDKNNEPTDNSHESLLSQVQGTRKDVSASIARSLGNLKTSLEERTSGSDDFIETRILEARRDLSESKTKIASLARIR